MKNSSIIFILLIFCQFITAQSIPTDEPEVRVRIINTEDLVKIKFSGDWICESQKLQQMIKNGSEFSFSIKNNSLSLKDIYGKKITEGNLIRLLPSDSTSTIDIYNVPYGVGWWWEGEEDRTYEGEITLLLNTENKIEVIVKLPVEEYLKGVVPYEIGGDSPLEALKAQAVAARSEAFAALNSGLYSGPHYDLTSDVECQVFSGNRKRTELSDIAVEGTRGLVLTESGEVINAYYASNCGGHSELIKNVWPDRPEKNSYAVAERDWPGDAEIDLSDEETVLDWIQTKPESHCNPYHNLGLPAWSQKNFRWERNFGIEEISAMINMNELGKLLDIVPIKRGASGRMIKARFIFEDGDLIEEGELSIRMLFKPALRSSCFIVEKNDYGFHLKGAGWGHGVGMCQSGAVAQAIQGKSYESILNHYYKKAELKKLY